MIKVFCDNCGKELKEDCSDQVNIDINCFQVSGIKNEGFNYCPGCAKTIISYLQTMKDDLKGA